jgi:Cytochrome P460
MRIMQGKGVRSIAVLAALLSAVSAGAASAQGKAQDKYAQKVPGGLAFSEFRGYEGWQLVSVSEDGGLMAAILANPVMIRAYEAGIPGNGKPFPDGSKMAKIHWNPKKLETFPSALVPGSLHDTDFMVKDSKRFKDSGGWGWEAFEYDTAPRKLTPATTGDRPPQGNDAKCGLGCHTIVEKRDTCSPITRTAEHSAPIGPVDILVPPTPLLRPLPCARVATRVL